jgi:hypothetical protein
MNIVAPDRAASTWMISFTDANRSPRLIHKPLFPAPYAYQIHRRKL